ncbi:SUMO-interacting motif-containing protein 1 isoform X2 [Phyllobates terribilis]|uniref:SUMO-interacting motif-containing protein 1 isoform X2 n=1 Tax=Phyllobates terribilis TaxID=111132 RepID=UPI003CCA8E3C
MDEVIVLSPSDESEEDSYTWRRRRRPQSPAPDVIDLTDNGGVFAYMSSSDEDIIDLTGLEEDASNGFLQNIELDSQCNISSLSEHSGSDPGREEVYSSSMNKSCNREVLDSDESSSCSIMCSSKSMRSCLPGDGLHEHTDADLPSTSSMNHINVNSSPLQESAETNIQIHQVKSSTFAQFAAMLEDAEEASESKSDVVNKSLLYNEEASESESDLENKSLLYNEASESESDLENKSLLYNEKDSASKSDVVNKSLVYKLRYFKKPPVTHLFPHTTSQPAPVPLTRMNLINSTIEESFHPGTLYFLSEFVSATHYPPTDIISHVIKSVLLGAEEQTIRHEAYVILMKVQRLHPATSESVAWQWNLLSEVMTSKQEYQTVELFLQYVVQTLDDDFHLCLQRRALHKSLCKLMLSCDKSFCNVKQVIHWLIDVVKQIPETAQEDSFSECNLQRTVFLLQRMLSIAVDVDGSPTMNSNKMADYIFPYVMVLKTRQQRELFFSSTGNVLLRAKILERIFHHSCTIPPAPELSLSFGEILYFISNSTVQLENQGPEWQKWDEILHHLTVLCLSLQTIITDHLRTPVIDRTDEILKRPQSLLDLSGGITESEVDSSLTLFKQRTSLEAEPSAALLNRLFLLRSLLFTAVKRFS